MAATSEGYIPNMAHYVFTSLKVIGNFIQAEVHYILGLYTKAKQEIPLAVQGNSSVVTRLSSRSVRLGTQNVVRYPLSSKNSDRLHLTYCWVRSQTQWAEPPW